MKSIIYILAFSFLGCNNAIFEGKNLKNQFPKEIDNTELKYFFNRTKWMLYCIECDKKCILSDNVPIKDSTYFGFLDLKLIDIKSYQDTTEINMAFYYNDTIICDINTVYHLGFINTGAVFKGNSDSILFFKNNTNADFYINYKMTDTREVYPLQPDVINFIKSNKDKLNPWFREEAKSRGIIK